MSWLWELKTCGANEDISDGGVYFKKLTLDSQVSGYIAAARREGHDVKGVVYDVVSKTGLRPTGKGAETPESYEARIIEERETEDGVVAEVSRNYFAIHKTTHDVFYFGEDVDAYKNGVLASHEGSWQAGSELANFGLMLPAKTSVGAKWYQEMAPEVALDRSEVLALDKSFECPAGKFTKCLEIEETTPLESTVKEKKLYAPGVGLVKDGSLRLISYGKAGEKR